MHFTYSSSFSGFPFYSVSSTSLSGSLDTCSEAAWDVSGLRGWRWGLWCLAGALGAGRRGLVGGARGQVMLMWLGRQDRWHLWSGGKKVSWGRGGARRGECDELGGEGGVGEIDLPYCVHLADRTKERIRKKLLYVRLLYVRVTLLLYSKKARRKWLAVRGRGCLGDRFALLYSLSRHNEVENRKKKVNRGKLK